MKHIALMNTLVLQYTRLSFSESTALIFVQGEYNDMATLCLSPQEQSVAHLLGVQDLRFTPQTLLTFSTVPESIREIFIANAN